MTKNITVERHGNDWCLKDGQGVCLIVTPDRVGLDRIVQQISVSQAADKLPAVRQDGFGTHRSDFIFSLR